MYLIDKTNPNNVRKEPIEPPKVFPNNDTIKSYVVNTMAMEFAQDALPEHLVLFQQFTHIFLVFVLPLVYRGFVFYLYK